MNKPTKKEITDWCNALRSGEYKQTKGRLQDEDGFCCLGVLYKTQIPEDKIRYRNNGKDYIFGGLPKHQPNAKKWMKNIDTSFDYMTSHSLIDLNDELYFTFDEIADLLEAVYIHEVLK